MLKNVVAIERDGLAFRELIITFEVPSEDFDLEYYVKKAATDYCLSEEGRKVYDYNCHCFNWSDFEMNVPNEFCEKYGFRKVTDGILSDITVDLDEELVDESLFNDEDEEGE